MIKKKKPSYQVLKVSCKRVLQSSACTYIYIYIYIYNTEEYMIVNKM